MRRVIAQARKELTQLFRDRLALALALLLPLILLMLMGSAISLTVTDLPVAVQDLDGSTESNAFIDAFRASITFHVVSWAPDRSPQEALTSNAARGVLIIPRDFARNIARGTNANVQMLVDGSDANTARLISGYASQIARSFNRKDGPVRATPVKAEMRLWFNPGRVSKKFYGPGIFVLGLSMFPPLLATLAMAKEGEEKTILQVYVSNISAHEFLLGKILAFMIVALMEWALMMILLFTYFGLRIEGDPTPFIVATILYAFCVATFGTLVGSAIPNQAAAMQAVALGGFLLVFLLSGLTFPVENIPRALRWVSNIVWGRYYIQIVRDTLLQGGGWPALWFPVMVIAIIGGIFYLIAWRKMHRMQLAY